MSVVSFHFSTSLPGHQASARALHMLRRWPKTRKQPHAKESAAVVRERRIDMSGKSGVDFENSEMVDLTMQTSGEARREIAKLFQRHCERSEAIHASALADGWIASLRSQ